MLEIVICDDNKRFLDNMCRIVDKLIVSNNLNAKVVCKASSTYDIELFLKHKSANVFFMDISLNSNDNGYEFALKLRKKDNQAYIIFISGHLEYVLQSFKTKPFNFIPKPVTKEILEQCLIEIYDDHLTKKQTVPETIIQIKSGTILHNVKINDILFIEKNKSKTIVHTEASIIQCNNTLNFFEQALDSNNFIRCHRSYICNKKYIKEIQLKEMKIILEAGKICHIGRKYKRSVHNCLKK